MSRRHLLRLSLLLALIACAVGPQAATAFEPELRGEPVQGAIAPGSTLPPMTFTTLQGAAVSVPDPSGGYVVLELIRSADW